MKVRLINEKGSAWFGHLSVAIKSTLPFYQRDGDGYVHRVRSSHMHHRPSTGEYTHTSVRFWCGSGGFLYPKGKQNRKHKPAHLTSTPSPHRVLCATCEGRAIGSGQVTPPKIGDRFVKYTPHQGFFETRAP